MKSAAMWQLSVGATIIANSKRHKQLLKLHLTAIFFFFAGYYLGRRSCSLLQKTLLLSNTRCHSAHVKQTPDASALHLFIIKHGL